MRMDLSGTQLLSKSSTGPRSVTAQNVGPLPRYRGTSPYRLGLKTLQLHSVCLISSVGCPTCLRHSTIREPGPSEVSRPAYGRSRAFLDRLAGRFLRACEGTGSQSTH